MDDSKWHIGGKVLFLNGKVYNKQIKNVIAGRMLQEIKVILETEEKVFKLENYSPPIGSGYKADVHGRSRSLFLKWLNFQREFQSSDVEEEEEKQQQNSGSLYIDDENDDSKSRNSSIDASWKELTASEEQVLDEEKNEQVHKGIKKKDDENDEESKLIGENVLVNIGNLRPAKPERMVRQVNRRHIEELVSSFLSAKVFTQYTPMVGVVFSEEKEIDFLQNGTCVVEVLGGNHTLQALLEIKAQLDIVTVTIRLYRNLTDQQCLRIGFKHNDVHEKSRKNTFSEQCLLARRLLSDTRRRFRNMGKKNQMTIWREEVATVFGVNKEAIKNTGRVLLHIASLSDQLWDAMTKVFHQWENGRILKQARGEIMKNTFSCITNIANEQEKLELLTQLATGKLEWKLFKKECAKRKAKGKCVKHAAAEPLRAQVEVRNDAYQFPSDEEEEVEVSLAISEASMSSVGTPPKEIQAQQKEDNNNDDLIKSLQEDLETKRKECLQLVKTLNEKDSLIQEMEFTIDSHSKTISTLKNRVSFAESAASRAREELKQMQTDKKQRGQKHNEKVATNLKNVAAKTAKPSEQSAPDDVATNLKNVAAKTAKPSEQSAPDDVDSNATTANKEKGKKRSDNQDSAYSRKKTKLGAVETLNNNEDVIEQKDCALVEYVKGSCYIGVLDDDKLTYCKRPCVKRGEDLAFSKDSLTLNNRDIQKIDQKFVIKKFKGAIVNNTITVNQDDINALKEAFKRYMSEADDFTET